MQKNNPDNFLFIIGAMKSGTTSLFDILAQHPEICPCKVKEPDYFIDNKPFSSDYFSLWDWNPSINNIAMEASVAYSKWPIIKNVPQRIFESKLGKCKFIYILREPISRIESQVKHGLFSGWGKSLENGLTNDLIDFTRYALQIEKFTDYFSLDNILIFTLEEFKENPESVLLQICQFLDVDINFQFHDVANPRNSGDFFNSPKIVSSLTQNHFSESLKNYLPSGIKSFIRNQLTTILSRPNTSAPDRWRLNDDEKKFIMNSLSDDLQLLKKKYGVDIDKYWTDSVNINAGS